MPVETLIQMKLNSGCDWVSVQWCGLSRQRGEIKGRTSPAGMGTAKAEDIRMTG